MPSISSSRVQVISCSWVLELFLKKGLAITSMVLVAKLFKGCWM